MPGSCDQPGPQPWACLLRSLFLVSAEFIRGQRVCPSCSPLGCPVLLVRPAFSLGGPVTALLGKDPLAPFPLVLLSAGAELHFSLPLSVLGI